MRKCRSCHCGAVRFEVETDFPEIYTCDCSICRRKNALVVKVRESRFKLLAGESELTEYQFHTWAARHYFCKTCGIYPFHRKRVTPDNMDIAVTAESGSEINGRDSGTRSRCVPNHRALSALGLFHDAGTGHRNRLGRLVVPRHV